MNNTGFTIIELLLSIVIVGILAAVLIPSLLSTRAKAADGAATGVANRVLNALAATETMNTGTTGLDGACVYAAETVTVTSGSVTNAVSAPGPVTDVTCLSTPTEYSVSVTYTGGRSGLSPITLVAMK
ncbi:type II secretion system protein [Deinococcus xianganensis]|uniref:Prepilin-type N-terminal cleavage/methylation domain-containing protein n=1 Tax=Deinococcus xianganensis TaxID=1507289 RepID=A0A6I4YHR1_9DEIO|nr:type II secretion system protein [Deinococcus xianganensis]MXV20328.1 prepilin-type N-terminal cleavage/methylation domain-containing protein [Deinococcus xianganensis]